MHRQLPGGIALADDARDDDPGVGAAQAQLAADWRAGEGERVLAEPRHELLAARMGLRRELDHRRPQLDAGPGRQVVEADVQVEVELVARLLPAIRRNGEERRGPGVHDGELGLRVRRAIGRAAAPALPPGVAHEALCEVERPLGKDLPLVHRRPPHDEVDPAEVMGRLTDVIEAPLEGGGAQVLHTPSMPRPMRTGKRAWAPSSSERRPRPLDHPATRPTTWPSGSANSAKVTPPGICVGGCTVLPPSRSTCSSAAPGSSTPT